MSNDIQEQLQAALGSDYTIGQELGGGGMSRVFLAHEPALDRTVVVKVLHPDLASGVNVDRFKREIQLAAQLQHPHIVPLLQAGEMNGIPYLTMPFVSGLSLRQRLTETGPLPLDESLDILRDVARALAFAHGRGIIHRDIKPDNVLLAEGSATVTDFGVAKAVTAARSGANATLTSIGTSIGTPAYMSPEQAAGDPSTDHRADIYAWGVMAFEMLAGRPPFTAKSPHKLLAAHMSEAPDPVTDHRPDCPPQLAAIIAHCLAKDPDQRPQTAGELLRAIAEVRTPSGGGHETLPAISIATRRNLVRALSFYAAAFVLVAALAQTAVVLIGLPNWVLPGTLIVMALGLPVVLFTAFVHHGSRVARTMARLTPGGSITANSTMTRIAVKASPHLTWRRTALGGAVAVGGFATLVVAFMIMRAFGIGWAGTLKGRGIIAENDRILVADFRAPASDSSLGPVVSEGVRTGLAQSASFGVVPATQVAGALQRMQLEPTSRVDLALARQIAEREGIKAIVDGDVTPVASSFIITVKLYATSDSVQIASYQESARDATDLIPAIDRAVRRIREKVGDSFKSVREAVPLERVTTASLPALRKYTEGFRHNTLAQNFPAAIEALEEAVRLDSTFAMALRQLGIVYGNAQLRPGRGDSLRGQAFRHRHRLPPLELALVEASYYESASVGKRVEALAAYRRALAVDPRSPSALNNLALRYNDQRQYAMADSLFRLEREVQPDIIFGYSNGAIAAASAGNLDDAKGIYAEARRRFPTTPVVRLLGAGIATLERGPGNDSALAICREVSTGPSAQRRSDALNCLADHAFATGKLGEGLARRAEAQGNAANRGVSVSTLAAVLDTALVLSWFHDRRDEAARKIDGALQGKPLRDLPPPSRLYFPLSEIYAFTGRADRAREMLAQYDDDVRDTVRRRMDLPARQRVEGMIALAERRYPEAVRALQKSDTAADGQPSNCAVCTSSRLAMAYDLAGETDKAIATLEEYIGNKHWFRLRDADRYFLAGSYKRLGELYETKGDTAKAVANLGKFIALWEHADPELQPKVAEAKKKLERLTARSR